MTREEAYSIGSGAFIEDNRSDCDIYEVISTIGVNWSIVGSKETKSAVSWICTLRSCLYGTEISIDFDALLDDRFKLI